MKPKIYLRFLLFSAVLLWLIPTQGYSQTPVKNFSFLISADEVSLEEVSMAMEHIELKLLFYGLEKAEFQITRKDKKISVALFSDLHQKELGQKICDSGVFGIVPIHKWDDEGTMTALFETFSKARIRDDAGRNVMLTSIFDLNTTTIEGYKFRIFPPAVIGMASPENISLINTFLQEESVQASLPPNSQFVWSEKASPLFFGKYDLYLIHKIPDNSLNEVVVEHAKVYKEANRFNRVRDLIDMQLDEKAYKAMEELTIENKGRELLVIYDDRALTAPRVEGPIRDGKLRIEGLFTGKEALALSKLIRRKPLPFSLVLDNSKAEN